MKSLNKARIGILLLLSLLLTSCLDMGLSEDMPQDNIDLKEVPGGTRVEVFAEPKSGFIFSHWTIGDEITSFDASYVFIMPAKDLHLTAHFRRSN